MSSITWTPDALLASARALAGRCWRMVEAQHRVSSLKLVDGIDEHALLEDLIESAKPPVPPECRHLHVLLMTPFRYGAGYPTGSRFRRAGMTHGVFYASETVETAIAEIAFRRLLFFAESPATPWPTNPARYTAFAAGYAAEKAIDLTEAPFVTETAVWLHPTDLIPCQALADVARMAAIEIIRYASARDPGRGSNLALLTCRVFTSPKPIAQQTWYLRLSAVGVLAIGEEHASRLAFDRGAFASDPRIAALRWER